MVLRSLISKKLKKAMKIRKKDYFISMTSMVKNQLECKCERGNKRK